MTRYMKPLCLLASGVAAGIALVLACGEGAVGPDAATAQSDAANGCDCPAPPQPFDQRLRRVVKRGAFPTEDTTRTMGVDCVVEFGTGSWALSGSCIAPGIGGQPNFMLAEAGRVQNDETKWYCVWRKDAGLGPLPDVQADVVCVVPEGTPLPDAGI